MKHLYIAFTFIFLAQLSFAQKDSLVFKNGNYMTGEIKSMTKGVLQVETDYSDSDFKIEWKDVAYIHSEQNFNFYLIDGRRLSGKISIDTANNGINVLTEEGTISIQLDQITEVSTFDVKIIDRISASIDFGYSITKANTLQQLSLRSNVSYTARKWKIYGSVNTIRSSQENAPTTTRTDGAIGLDYFLNKNYFARIKNDFLSNDEQDLELRSVTSVGLGKFIVRTNKLYWNILIGTAYNNEAYIVNDSLNKSSQEGLIATEFNAFDTGDLSLSTSIVAYPSFTESGRVRSDFKFDLKYDLPLDFYIGLGATVNYDNQPVEGASDTDYVLQTTFGWEL